MGDLASALILISPAAMRSCLGDDSSTVLPGPITSSVWGTRRTDNGVGPARIGLEPVARADRHPLGHRAEAIVHYRPNGHQPLGIGHLADAAVFGQRSIKAGAAGSANANAATGPNRDK